jgi:PilZ domain
VTDDSLFPNPAAISMVTSNERRKEPRVLFDLPLDVRVMTVDGTWTGDCLLIEMTDGGAQLKVTDHAAALTEFFLILNSFGPPVFRHCKRAWVDGDRMGVSFNKANIGIKSLEEVRRGAELV